MDWLTRLRRRARPVADPEIDSSSVVRAAPGLEALFEGVTEDRSHAVLDLGPAADASLRVYSRFARRVRFADVVGARSDPGHGGGVLDDLPPQPEHPYDLLLVWDALEWVPPKERARLVDHLMAVSAPGARLHVVIAASEDPGPRPRRFAVVDVGRMGYELADVDAFPRGRLFPADVERLLRPFEVMRAFSLMGGLREYVARRPG